MSFDAVRPKPPALPPMPLGRGLRLALIALRVLLGLMTVMAVWAFIKGLG
ncbi:MAG: hypothetical protein PW843_06515 [Azospirillaceae bacterium]|nr:hypothetical protein [Azospirillaceae bacterium]